MFKYRNKGFCLFLILFVSNVVEAEFRDPTRPTGIYQDVESVDTGLQKSNALKLQAIFYRPENASVLINGQRFVVGDLVAGAEIKAVYSDHVVLLSEEGVKELTLKMPSVKSRVEPEKGIK